MSIDRNFRYNYVNTQQLRLKAIEISANTLDPNICDPYAELFHKADTIVNYVLSGEWNVKVFGATATEE